ncbi:MAG TPA: serine/threonine-protein kinase [Ktedonobacteraceae bacterium]
MRCFACGALLPAWTAAQNAQNASGGTLLHARYQPGAILGLGGYSMVYRAWDKQKQLDVAIKRIMLRGLSAEETIEATSTYNREIEALSALNHPQIPRLYDHFSDPDHWYLVLEFIKGQTLEAFLNAREAQNRPLSLEEILAIGLQLCTVLEHLHMCQPPLIFRDLKPSNIMRTPGGKLYLIDFGIARRYTQGRSRDTQSLGSPGYAAPEQYGRAQTDARADLYSLGALLQQLLTGHDPSQQQPGLPSSRLNGRPGNAELETLIARLLASDPRNRPATANDLNRELERIRRIERAAQESGRIWQPPVPQAYSSALASAAFTAAQLQLQQMAAGSPPLSAAARRKRLTRRRVLIGLGASTTLVAGGLWLSSLHTSPSPAAPEAMQRLFTYEEHNNTVTSITWTLDGQAIISASKDQSVRTWYALNGTDRAAPQTFPSAVNSIACAPAGTYATGCEDGTVSVWNASERIFMAKHGAAVNNVAWASDSLYLASSSNDMSVRVWNIADRTSGVLKNKQKGIYYTAAWSPDNVYLATASSKGTSIDVWIANDLKMLVRSYQISSDTIYALTWSYDGKYLAAAGQNRTVNVWEVQSGVLVTTYTGHSAPVRALSWLPGSAVLASAGDDATVQVWDAFNSSSYGIYTEHAGAVYSVAWSPNGQYIASAGVDHTVQVWVAPQT